MKATGAAPATTARHVEARLHGVDFTSTPSRRKPITIASGSVDANGALVLATVDDVASLDAFGGWLRREGPWLGGFDFPFGLPRVFVEAHGLGATTADVIAAVRSRWPTRADFRAAIDAWGNGRAAGDRLVHRATDRAGGVASTSPLQTRYVPVGFMYFEGVAALVDAGVTMAGLHEGDASRVALEAYPRRLAHAVVGRRSYKNGDDADRRAAREAIVAALPLAIDDAVLRRSLVEDASGDRLDAVLCLVQAHAASQREGFGLPRELDVVEGWIVA